MSCVQIGGSVLSDRAVGALFRAIDSDASGVISLDEFLHWLSEAGEDSGSKSTKRDSNLRGYHNYTSSSIHRNNIYSRKRQSVLVDSDDTSSSETETDHFLHNDQQDPTKTQVKHSHHNSLATPVFGVSTPRFGGKSRPITPARIKTSASQSLAFGSASASKARRTRTPTRALGEPVQLASCRVRGEPARSTHANEAHSKVGHYRAGDTPKRGKGYVFLRKGQGKSQAQRNVNRRRLDMNNPDIPDNPRWDESDEEASPLEPDDPIDPNDPTGAHNHDENTPSSSGLKRKPQHQANSEFSEEALHSAEFTLSTSWKSNSSSKKNSKSKDKRSSHKKNIKNIKNIKNTKNTMNTPDWLHRTSSKSRKEKGRSSLNSSMVVKTPTNRGVEVEEEESQFGDTVSQIHDNPSLFRNTGAATEERKQQLDYLYYRKQGRDRGDLDPGEVKVGGKTTPHRMVLCFCCGKEYTV